MKRYVNKFLLNKKVAFVCGGAGLLGKEVINALADAGAKVVILDIQKPKEKNSHSFEFFDVTNLEDIDEAIDKLYKKYKKIDVFVNASYPKTSDWGNKLENLSIKSWKENVDMHLNSYSWISRKICLIMKKQKRGSLINFGSIYGVVGNNFNVYEGTNLTSPMAYSAIKGGIINLGRYLASYFGEFNVRVNTICPGGIFNSQNEIFIRNYGKLTPLKRMGKPEEVAAAVLFLSSDASSYITGITLMVDGGWTAI